MINQEERALLTQTVLSVAERMECDEVLDLADALHDLIRARRAKPDSYAILRCGSEWQIVCRRRRMGHFQDREDALAAGARLARQARAAGHPVQLLVQDGGGQLAPLDLDRIETGRMAEEPRAFA